MTVVLLLGPLEPVVVGAIAPVVVDAPPLKPHPPIEQQHRRLKEDENELKLGVAVPKRHCLLLSAQKDGSALRVPVAKLLQVGTPLGFTSAISAKMVLKIVAVVTWLIDVVLPTPSGQVCAHEEPSALIIQPSELVGMAVGHELVPQQHRRRCPLVAPVQVEFMLERRQFSVLEVENDGVAELDGSEKKVVQAGCTLLSAAGTVECTVPIKQRR